MAQAHLAWTGGYDSTYRLLYLLESGAKVQTHYLACRVDGRQNTASELATIQSLTHALQARYPEQMLAPKIVSRYPADDAIRLAFNAINSRLPLPHRLGNQYSELAQYAHAEAITLEVAAEPGGRMERYLSAPHEWDGNHHEVAFSSLSWPTLSVIKEDMLEWAYSHDLDSLLAASHSCWYSPIPGRSCGDCEPCRRRILPHEPLPAPPRQYDVSICIPCWGGRAPDLVENCLISLVNAVAESTLKAELILADGSTPGLPVWLPDVCADHGIDLTVVPLEDPTLGGARNAACSAAKGEVLAVYDSDMLVSTESLTKAVQEAQQGRGRCVQPICYGLPQDGRSDGYWRGTEPAGTHLGGTGSCGNAILPRWMYLWSGGWEEIEGWANEDSRYRDKLLAGSWQISRYRDAGLLHQWHDRDTSNPQHQRGVFKPTPMPRVIRRYLRRLRGETAPERPPILLIADVRDWAFDRNARDLMRHLSDRFDFDLQYVEDGPERLSTELFDQYDAILPFYIRWGIEARLPLDRTICFLAAQYLFLESQTPPGDRELQWVRDYTRMVCVNERATQWYRDLGIDAVCLTNPVEMQRHPKQVTDFDDVRPCWAGNSKRTLGTETDPKGYQIVVDGCEAAGLPLTIADWHTQRIPMDEMPQWYTQSNVLICGSSHEGASNVINEALASGLIVISTETGHIPEMVESQIQHQGESGIIVVDRTPEAITEALTSLQRMTPEQRARMGDINRTEIVERWSWEQWADRYAAVLQEVVDNAD